MIRHLSLALALSFGIISSNATAGICAKGYITVVAEGSYGSNDLMFQMDYTSDPPPTAFGGVLMRFRTSLDPRRLRAIRAMAYMAVINGNEVEVRTTNVNSQGVDDCTRATELKILQFPTP